MSRALRSAAFKGGVTIIASAVPILRYEKVLLRPDILEQAGAPARDALGFGDAIAILNLRAGRAP